MGGRNCCKCVTVSLVPTASLILVIMFACGIVLLPILYIELSRHYKYGIIIDAGSSHTNLYAYRWRVPTYFGTGNIEVNEYYQCNESRSLNNYASSPNRVSDAFEECIAKSQNYRNVEIDNSDYKHTPIFLGATAGMRILDATDKTASDNIMNEVRKALKRSHYNFTHEMQSARIITGEEEAIGGWNTANYLSRNFKHPGNTVGLKTIGSLDLGGASAEIAFNVSVGSTNYTETLFGQNYTLFARSYLCYGVNEAHSRFLAYLHNKSGNITPVPNPCLMKNALVSYHHSNIYTGCVNITSSVAIQAFGFGYAPPTSLGADDEVTFNGTWDMTACKNAISSVFNSSWCLPGSNCKPAGSFSPPPVEGDFVAFSAFYWTASYFNQSINTVSKSNKTYTWDNFRGAVDKNCSQGNNNSCIINGKERKNCYQKCFNGIFTPFLLENGFGFSDTSANSWSVTFKDIIDSVSVGWALGYMLEETSQIPQEDYVEYRPYTAVDLVIGILILSILCAVFVIFFFLTFYACRKALRARSGFQPL